MPDHEDEIQLTGGNVSDIYRSGNTVRRKRKPESDNVHKLLKHLEGKNYSPAPKFLGIDEKGREILSFIEGEAGNYPVKPYMWSNESLKEIAKLLRLYHDAVSDFPFDESWQSLDNTPPPYDVICHNDFAIYNIIFNQETPVGIIDFDTVGPGPRLWDIAYTLYTCIPLSRFTHSRSDENLVYYDSMQDAERMKKRVGLFFESYGSGVEGNWLAMVLLRLDGLCKTIHRKAGEGDLAFQKMITDGHVEHYQQEIQFIQDHGKEWV